MCNVCLWNHIYARKKKNTYILFRHCQNIVKTNSSFHIRGPFGHTDEKQVNCFFVFFIVVFFLDLQVEGVNAIKILKDRTDIWRCRMRALI